MNTKLLVTSTCVIALACGFIIGKISTRYEEKSRDSSASQTRRERPSFQQTRNRPVDDSALLKSIFGDGNVEEIPPTDLAALMVRLTKYEPSADALIRAKQSYQLQLLLAKLSPEKLTSIAGVVISDSETKHSECIDDILSALAKKDPARALDWVSGQEDPSHHYSVVIGGIAQGDPMGAVDLFEQALMDGRLSPNDISPACHSIAKAVARLGAKPLVGFIDSLPNRSQASAIQTAVDFVAEEDRINLLNEIYQRKPGILFREIGLNKVFATILSSDEASAKEWFSKLPNGEQKNYLRTNAVNHLLHSGRKENAGIWMQEALASFPGKEKEKLNEVIGNMAYTNPEDIPYLAEFLPESVEYTATELEGVAKKSLSAGGSGLSSVAAIISDPGEKARLIATTLKNISSGHGSGSKFNATDFQILTRTVAAMGLSGEDASLAMDAIEVAKNSALSDKE
jgi:hypothetical protein